MMQKLTAQDPEAKSADITAENIAQLNALFPELLTESANGIAVNLDVLKALVGDATVTDAEKKYGLNWHGKRRARQIALTPSTGTLRPCKDDSVDWDTKPEAGRREAAPAFGRGHAQPEKPAAGSAPAALGAREAAIDLLRRHAGRGAGARRGKRLAGRRRQARLDHHLAGLGIACPDSPLRAPQATQSKIPDKIER